MFFYFAAKLVETGTYAGDEDDDVLFDDMVDDYEDEDEAIDAVSIGLKLGHVIDLQMVG